MGKRGPQPKGGYEGKTAVLSTRITPELRKALEKAAADRGSSLSSEIESRLRRSFDYEGSIRDIFKDGPTYAFMRTLADVIEVTSAQAAVLVTKTRGKRPNWLNDPTWR